MSKISLVRKVTMIATMFALALAAFSATSAFAAGSTTKATSTQAVALNLENNWKAEGYALRLETAYFNHVDRFLDKSSRKSDSQNQKAYINFSVVLNKAAALVKSHTGFDASGKVSDQTQADKTVQQLSIYLSQLRSVLFYRLRNLI